MNTRQILMEQSDGTYASMMGFTRTTGVPQPAAPVKWWLRLWHILNTDLTTLWRTYGPARPR